MSGQAQTRTHEPAPSASLFIGIEYAGMNYQLRKRPMPSRTWVKIYCEKWLSGTLRQETPEFRGIWADILTLAGSGRYGDTGEIKLADQVALTDQQIAQILNVPLDLWQITKQRCLDTDRIRCNGTGLIQIVNWAKYQSEYERQKEYRQESPEARMNYSLGVALANSIKKMKDGQSWEQLLGYTRKELVTNLENQFQTGMSWDNYGKWHIDHIIPKSSFRFTSTEDKAFKQCWALKNLQPLWADDNMRKGYKQGLHPKVTNRGYTQRLRGERERERERE